MFIYKEKGFFYWISKCMCRKLFFISFHIVVTSQEVVYSSLQITVCIKYFIDFLNNNNSNNKLVHIRVLTTNFRVVILRKLKISIIITSYQNVFLVFIILSFSDVSNITAAKLQYISQTLISSFFYILKSIKYFFQCLFIQTTTIHNLFTNAMV